MTNHFALLMQLLTLILDLVYNYFDKELTMMIACQE